MKNLAENPELVAAARLFVMLMIGGLLAVFVRLLYQRFSRTLSNRDSFSAVFVPLTISTVLVIWVVKSSLALSLGLVGALSIVRFRAAIKDPEELTYLFFCIAIGLALGADQMTVTFVGVLVFTLFIVTLNRIGFRIRRHNLLLTVSGDRAAFFGDGRTSPQDIIDQTLGPYQVQRFEYDDQQVQFRATVTPESAADISRVMADLQAKLPECQVSYVNLDNLL